MQALQKVETRSICFVQSLQAQKVAREVAKETCRTLQHPCNLSRNVTATQAPDTTCRARFYILQWLLRLFEPSQVASCKQHAFGTIATCSSTLQHVTCPDPATCNWFLFPTLRDKLQRKLHSVTLALASSFRCKYFHAALHARFSQLAQWKAAKKY